MPVLHKRAGGGGYYVKGRLDGGFVTLQLVQPAQTLLNTRLGYEDGDTIPWKVMTPLCMLGHAYSKSGGGPGGDATGDDLSTAVQKLSAAQKRQLRSYLASYEGYTPTERDWVNKHVFNGKGQVSRSQLTEHPGAREEPDDKVKELASIWDDVAEGGDDPDSMVTGQEPTTRFDTDAATAGSASVSSEGTFDPAGVDVGSIVEVPVDRISNSGNVIVELEGRDHLNLGTIPAVAAGDRVPVKLVSNAADGGIEAVHVAAAERTDPGPDDAGLWHSFVSKLRAVF